MNSFLAFLILFGYLYAQQSVCPDPRDPGCCLQKTTVVLNGQSQEVTLGFDPVSNQCTWPQTQNIVSVAPSPSTFSAPSTVSSPISSSQTATSTDSSSQILSAFVASTVNASPTQTPSGSLTPTWTSFSFLMTPTNTVPLSSIEPSPTTDQANPTKIIMKNTNDGSGLQHGLWISFGVFFGWVFVNF